MSDTAKVTDIKADLRRNFERYSCCTFADSASAICRPLESSSSYDEDPFLQIYFEFKFRFLLNF